MVVNSVVHSDVYLVGWKAAPMECELVVPSAGWKAVLKAKPLVASRGRWWVERSVEQWAVYWVVDLVAR